MVCFSAPRRRWTDGGLVALGLGLTVLAAKTPWSALPLPVLVGGGIAASTALPLRRRWPVPVLVVATAGYALSGNPGPLLVAAFTAASLAADSIPRLALVAGLWSVGSWSVNAFDGGPFDLVTVIGGLLLGGALTAAGGYVGQRRRLVEALERQVRQAQTDRARLDELARSGERARIAREMHDVLAHKVSLIALHAGALEVNPGVGADGVESAAALVRSTASEALTELRTVLGVLRPPPGGDDTGPDVARVVEDWNRAGGRATLADSAGPLPAAAARAAVRLVQEGLANAQRHAPGAEVEVTVRDSESRSVVVTVHNGAPTGAGPAGPGAGMGLVGLGERLDLLGGAFRAGPTDDGGWSIEGIIPRTGPVPS